LKTLGSIRANRGQDGRLWSVPEMLEEALVDYRAGKYRHAKAILLLLDDEDLDGKPNYATTYYQAGMKFSQIVGLLSFWLHKAQHVLMGE
jgi:hypothetical protein